MVEQTNKAGGNAGEDVKATTQSKVQIPAANDAEEEKKIESSDVQKADCEAETEETEDGAAAAGEESKQARKNIPEIDQSKSNIPIMRPETESLLELLEIHLEKLPSINPLQKDLLRKGLE